ALDRRSVQGSRALERFKRDLFTSGVLQYCSDALRFEYAHVEGGLHTAAHLADVLSAFLTEIRPVVLEGILDDIVYKLGCGSSAVLGGGAARTLLLVAKSHSSIARSIPRKYRGLDALLKTDWRGKGFDAVVEQLLDLLMEGLPDQEEDEDAPQSCEHVAEKLPKRREELQSQRKKAEEELRLQVRLRRQRALREFHQRQLYLLEIVPAGQVDKYLAEVESRAAVIIQKVWRGHRERRSFQQQKEALGQFKAAVTIQRAFLKRRRILQSTLSPWRGPKGLTDARRAELMKQVEEHMARHPGGPMSPERCRELHRRTQEMLRQYLMGREVERRAEHHGQALLAQINTDIELLANAPPLKDVAEVDSDLYLSRSGPVAYRARQSHNALLNASRYPWWKRLGDEFQDPESVPAENLAENFESLYFG
ncbi:IQ calmodulin-binding motif-containing protein 1-like, partial [Scleropages formosus]